MKTGRSLKEVLSELAWEEEHKKDYLAPAAGFRLEDNGHTFDLGNGEALETTPLFDRQMASVLDIPFKYYERCQKAKPDLLAEQVNRWAGDNPNNYMVRTMDYGNGRMARALLSDRYHRIDNLQIAKAVLPLFAGKEQFHVESSEVTTNRLYLKILNTRLEAEVKPGDIVQAGVMIANSEVGLGAVNVQPLIYRLVCSNGMCVSLGTRKNHVGRQAKVEDSFELYSDEAKEAEDHAFMLKLRDVTMAAIEETKFTAIVETLRQSTERKITGSVPKIVEIASKNYGLNQSEQDGVLRYLIEGGDLSLYGLSNAITRTSQDVESYDRATALEGIGWQAATMPEGQWRELNNE